MQMAIAEDMGSLQKALAGLARQRKRTALVATMGALHDGHLTLVHEAKKHADAVILSIFVNPAQFGANEDFNKYPRPLEADLKKADEAGVTLAYTPSIDDMYPPGYVTAVSPGVLGELYCGRSRPGHFTGVATVVAKLLMRVMPHVALFGEKDYQQLCIIKRLAYDLDIPVEILGVPTVREADGLAMSSRNAYLSKEERALAPKLYDALTQTAGWVKSGMHYRDALAQGAGLLKTLGFNVEYLELCEAETLTPMEDTLYLPARLLAAVHLGNTRLIDNVAID